MTHSPQVSGASNLEVSPPDDAHEHPASYPTSDKRELMADEAGQTPVPESNPQPTRLPFKAVLLLVGVGVTLVWGAIYPVMKIAAAEISILTFRGLIAIGVALFVMILPLIFGYWAFFHIIEMVPANVGSLSIVVVPGVSLLLGPALVDEPITIIDLLAFGLIAGALLTVLAMPRLRRSGPLRTVN